MSRQSRHLGQREISEIIVSYHGGESQAAIARRFNIDHSTVHYHLRKYEESYPEQGGVYAFIKTDIKQVCLHPSKRCTCCGEMWDELNRKEKDEIRSLTERLKRANSKLVVAGFAVE